MTFNPQNLSTSELESIVGQNLVTNQSPETVSPVEGPFDFGLLSTEEIESLLAQQEPTEPTTTGREAARSLSRFGEGLLGAPGDIIQFALALGENLPGALGPEDQNLVQRGLRGLVEQVPTSASLKERMIAT